MSVEEFLAQVAWPGVQPSPSRGGEASAAHEFVPDVEDEPVPPKPFIFETNPVTQEEATAHDPISPIHISPAPISEDTGHGARAAHFSGCTNCFNAGFK